MLQISNLTATVHYQKSLLTDEKKKNQRIISVGAEKHSKKFNTHPHFEKPLVEEKSLNLI